MEFFSRERLLFNVELFTIQTSTNPKKHFLTSAVHTIDFISPAPTDLFKNQFLWGHF